MTDPNAPADPPPAPRMSGSTPMPEEQDPSGFFKLVGGVALAGTLGLLILEGKGGHLTGYDVAGAGISAAIAGVCWRPKWMNGLLQTLASLAPNWITAYKKPGS